MLERIIIKKVHDLFSLDCNIFYVLKDFNCYLRPLSAIIDLARISKPNKKNFSTKLLET